MSITLGKLTEKESHQPCPQEIIQYGNRAYTTYFKKKTRENVLSSTLTSVGGSDYREWKCRGGLRVRENLDLTERPYRLTDPEDTELRLPAQRGWEQHTWSAQTFMLLWPNSSITRTTPCQVEKSTHETRKNCNYIRTRQKRLFLWKADLCIEIIR